MKKATLLLVAFLLTLTAHAQEPQKFSPEKFEADMEAFITREAALTQQEAAKFFPLFREMHEQQRALYSRMRKAAKEKPADEKAALEAIRQCDKLNIEVKQLERKYHEKMLKELPAQKVYEAINAENRFHRQMMKGWQKQKTGAPKGKQKGKRH